MDNTVTYRKPHFPIRQHHKHIITLILLLHLGTVPTLVSGQERFDYNAGINEAYTAASALDFERGHQILDSIRSNDPTNLAVVHIENYIDFFTLFISEKQSDFDRLKANKEARLMRLESADPDDPYLPFVEAEIILQWALIRSKFDELFLSARELYKAYNILEDAQDDNPDFLLYNKSLSIIHALAETIPLPGFVKSVIGVSGSIEQGVTEITALIDNLESQSTASLFTQEAQAIYAFIILYQQNDPQAAWEYYQTSQVANNQSPVAKFVGVKIAQRSGHNTEAIQILDTVTDTEFEQFPYLSFLKGLCLLRDLDPEAEQYFSRFLRDFEGRHYIKEAYQKIGWTVLVMDNNIPGYKTAMAACQDQGYATIDDDKQALKDANSDQIPHPELLRARLLYDGGNYQRAFSSLIQQSHTLYYDEEYKAEYLYRMGRISQMLYNYPDAIGYYREIINTEQYRSTFYACNAALQVGIIFENQGDKIQAEQYFDQCLSMRPDKYQYSLHQKAKSGLNRIK